MMKEFMLFSQPRDCCGCGACANRCPKDAIAMQRDEFGFRYPVIQAEKCLRCGLCQTVCSFRKKNEAPLPGGAYAVQATDGALLERSASGGIFAVLAQAVLEEGGAVAGCALERGEAGLEPRHILIHSPAELEKLQGSKYVQSITGDIYRRVREELETGRQVLFSGTPCQVDGLKGYLGKAYPNLLTVDIICHGTPNDAFFGDYLRTMEKKHRGRVTDFKFRDKSAGWGLYGSVTVRDKKGNERKRSFPAGKSSYYKLFLGAETYRSSCYNCKYACMNRPGDLTIGDFWGIETQHPDYLKENGGALMAKKGISCLLVNSEQGKAALEILSARAAVEGSGCEAVACENMQLNRPSQPGKNRDKVLKMYREQGYPAVEKWFVRHRLISKFARKFRHFSARLFPDR